jgi:hypothetical protein
MASGLTVECLAEQHGRFRTVRGSKTSSDEVLTELQGHALDLSNKRLRQPRIVRLASDYPMVVTACAVWLSEIRPPMGRRAARCERWQPGRTKRIPGSRDGRVSPPRGMACRVSLASRGVPAARGERGHQGQPSCPHPAVIDYQRQETSRVTSPGSLASIDMKDPRAGGAPQRSKTNTE